MYTFTCTCGQGFPISPARAGQSVDCPHCGLSIDLPKLGEIKQLPPAEASESKRTIAKKWSKEQGIVFSLLGTLLVVLASIAGWSTYNWLRIPAQPTVQEFIENGQEELAQQNASELMKFWINFARPGIGPRYPPVYLQIHQYRTRWKRWAIGFGIAASVVAVGMIVVSRKKTPMATPRDAT